MKTKNGQSGVSLAYLIGHYPGVSLTFILREVTVLRELGIDIRTASVNAAQPSQDGFTPLELQEQQQTFYVKARGITRIAADHIRCLGTRPLSYIRGFWFAVKMGGIDLRALLFHILYFAEAVVVGEWALRNRIEHIHVHFAVNTATVALIASKIFPLRYSISVHGPNEFYGVEQYRLREKIEGASFLCCIGQFCRSQLMRIVAPEHWPKFHIAPLGVDPEVFGPRAPAATVPVNILCVGRVVPEKGQSILVSAVAHLIENKIPVHLHIAGDGPYRGVVENQARALGVSNAVTFHGSINQTNLRALLNKTDVFVLASFAEGIPVALMEAMAMEIPCISTFVAGIPELIDSGRNGILVPPSDANLLAEAIRTLATDPQLRLTLGAAGRRKVIDKYNLKPNVERLGGIFQECISSNSRT